MKRREESSSISVSLIFLRRWRFQFEGYKEVGNGSCLFEREGENTRESRAKSLRRCPRIIQNLMLEPFLEKI